MPDLDEVYIKFGEAAEVAQILETELGNILFSARGKEHDLFSEQNPALARNILNRIDKSTLGQLLSQLSPIIESEGDLERVLVEALDARNRLAHSFFREHNFRRNSEEGRAIMIADLEALHDTLLDAYNAVLALAKIELGAVDLDPPTGHVPI